MTTVSDLGLSSIGSSNGEVSRLQNLGADFESYLDEMKETSAFYDQMIKAFEGNEFTLKVTLDVSECGANNINIADKHAVGGILRILKDHCEQRISYYRHNINRTAKEIVNE